MEGMPLAWQLSATPFLYVPTPRVMGLLSRDGELQPWQCPPAPHGDSSSARTLEACPRVHEREGI